MNEPILLFETDSRLGVPKLRSMSGVVSDWSLKELDHLEEQLRQRYDGLVRDGDGTIDFKGRMLYVNKKAGDTSRQPTLEVRSEAQSAVLPIDRFFCTPKYPDSPAGWGQGFLAEVDLLFTTPEFNAILPVEQAMLKLVRDELKALLDRTLPSETALFVLVAMLLMAEQLVRANRPGDPHPYTFALSGIERLVSRMPEPVQTPWGPLPTRPTGEAAPRWLGKFWKRLTGA